MKKSRNGESGSAAVPELDKNANNESGAAVETNSGLLSILTQSIKKVPANKYAYGVVGIVAAAILATRIAGSSWLTTVSAGVAMFTGMVLLRTFAQQDEAGKKKNISLHLSFLNWVCLMAFLCVLGLLVVKLYTVLFPSDQGSSTGIATAIPSPSPQPHPSSDSSSTNPQVTGSLFSSTPTPTPTPSPVPSPTAVSTSIPLQHELLSASTGTTVKTSDGQLYVSVIALETDYGDHPFREKVNFTVGVQGGDSTTYPKKDVGDLVKVPGYEVRVDHLEYAKAYFDVTHVEIPKKTRVKTH